jgi:hypothetical protein
MQVKTDKLLKPLRGEPGFARILEATELQEVDLNIRSTTPSIARSWQRNGSVCNAVKSRFYVIISS